MISYLEGKIKYKGVNYLILLASSVGYKVYTSLDFLSQTKVQQKISLYTYTYVKEDVLDLYGFPTTEELALFELLIGVSGVGPKIAVAIFAKGNINQIKESIVKGNTDFFTGVPRLGKKNAQKIIIELRSKLGSLEELDLSEETSEEKEIIEALKTFGFKLKEAAQAVKSTKNINGDTSEKIRQALKYLGKK